MSNNAGRKKRWRLCIKNRQESVCVTECITDYVWAQFMSADTRLQRGNPVETRSRMAAKGDHKTSSKHPIIRPPQVPKGTAERSSCVNVCVIIKTRNHFMLSQWFGWFGSVTAVNTDQSWCCFFILRHRSKLPVCTWLSGLGANTAWQRFNCLIFNMDAIYLRSKVALPVGGTRPAGARRVWNQLHIHQRWAASQTEPTEESSLGLFCSDVSGVDVRRMLLFKRSWKHQDPFWTYELALCRSSPCSTPLLPLLPA